jgi:ATP-dependent 26S proteasome regulatory subunit
LQAHAVIKSTGATFFNISASVIDGKYEGKKAAMMLHMCFKLAKIMSPAVIYIENVEQVRTPFMVRVCC